MSLVSTDGIDTDTKDIGFYGAIDTTTGEEVSSEPMGSDDSMNTDSETGLDDLESPDAEVSDEFGATDAEAGGTEPEGREQRESKEVFETSNRLYSKLAAK